MRSERKTDLVLRRRTRKGRVLCPFADVEKNLYIGDMKTRSIFDGVFSYLKRNCLGFVVGINF